MKGRFQQLPAGQNKNDRQAKIRSLLHIFVMVVLATVIFTLIWCMFLSHRVSVLENTVEELRSCLQMMSKERNFSENSEIKSENKSQIEMEVGNNTRHIRSLSFRDTSKRKGKQHKKKKFMCKHPSAHMVAPTDFTMNSQQNERDTRFVWSFGDRGHSDFDLNPSSSAFRIREAGYYYVYFQITYNGRNSSCHSISSPWCSAYLCQTSSSKYHEGDNSHDYKIIAYAVTTQQKMGCRIAIRTTNTDTEDNNNIGQDIFAYDTAYTGGIFYLDADDYIYIKPYDSSCTVIYLEDRTFFGLYRIQ